MSSHPAARLVFDDDGVEVVAREGPLADVVAPVVLTGAASRASVDERKPGDGASGASSLASKMIVRLGDFFGGSSNKRERVASPAVRAHRRRTNGARGSDLSRLARELAQALDEPKVRLLARAIDALGESTCRAYAEEAAATQENGGEWTANGERKRTTGGIFWSIIRTRTSKETYDDIFAEERERQKERVKARRARRRVADGKENVPPAGNDKPTMAQILFGSIRDEHFRAPLMEIDPMTPKATIRSFSATWADECEDEDMEDVDFGFDPSVVGPSAPMKPQRASASQTPTFASITRVR